MTEVIAESAVQGVMKQEVEEMAAEDWGQRGIWRESDQKSGQISPWHEIPNTYTLEKAKDMNKKFELSLIRIWCKI